MEVKKRRKPATQRVGVSIARAPYPQAPRLPCLCPPLLLVQRELLLSSHKVMLQRMRGMLAICWRDRTGTLEGMPAAKSGWQALRGFWKSAAESPA